MRKQKQSPPLGERESQEVQYQFHLPVDMATIMVQSYALAFTDAVSAYLHQQPSAEESQLEQQARKGLEKLKARGNRKPFTNDLEWLTQIVVRTYVNAYRKESRLLAEVQTPSYADRWRQLLSGRDQEAKKTEVMAAAKGAIAMLDLVSIDWEIGPQWSLPWNGELPALDPQQNEERDAEQDMLS